MIRKRFLLLPLLAVLLCVSSIFTTASHAQTFTTKQTLNYAGMPNSSFGAAGNTTSVPGMTDAEGNQARIQGGLLDMANEEKPVVFDYSITTPEGEQEHEWTIPTGQASGMWEPFSRKEVRGGVGYQLRVYVNLGGAVHVYDTNVAGVLGSFATSPALSLNNAKSYRFRTRVSGVGAASVFEIQVYNVTDAAAHLFNAGSDTWSVTLTDTGTQQGTAGFLSRPAPISLAVYRSTSVPPVLAVSTPTITSRTIAGVTGSVTFSVAGGVTGGTAPYSYQWQQVSDIYSAGATNISGATSSTVTRTGLTPDSLIFARVRVTDAVGAIVYSAVNGTVVPKLPYAEGRNVRLMALGDSITAGGSPRPIETTATRLTQLLGSPTAIPYTYFAQGGAAGTAFINNEGGVWTSFKDAALAFAPTHVLMRIGVNDFSLGYTAAQSAGYRLTIAQMIKAQIPSVQVVCLLHHTYTTEFLNGVQTPHPARHVWSRAEQAIQARYDNGTWLRVGPLLDYDVDIAIANSRTDPDGLHPNQAGANSKGEIDAAWLAQIVTGSIRSAGGGHSLSNNTIRGGR